VFGIGGMAIGYGEFTLSGISLCAIIALLLNLLLPGGEGWRNKQLNDEPCMKDAATASAGAATRHLARARLDVSTRLAQ